MQALYLPSSTLSLRNLAHVLATRLGFATSQTLPLNPRLKAGAGRLVCAVDLGERCAACHSPILMEDSDVGLCSNGHVWCTYFGTMVRLTPDKSHILLPVRCSVTSAILSTSISKACLGCCRKALTSIATAEQGGVRPACGWFVETLLESAQCCLYCGNRYIQLP